VKNQHGILEIDIEPIIKCVSKRLYRFFDQAKLFLTVSLADGVLRQKHEWQSLVHEILPFNPLSIVSEPRHTIVDLQIQQASAQALQMATPDTAMHSHNFILLSLV